MKNQSIIKISIIILLFCYSLCEAQKQENILTIAPPTISRFNIMYHAPSELNSMGDKDGIDYTIMGFVDLYKQFRPYRKDGMSNEDYFGFGMQLLAPISGTITQIKYPNGINPIGKMGVSNVGIVIITNEKGENLLLAHLDSIIVTIGQKVNVGDKLGIVSNNGNSRAPHIHLGAYKNDSSMLIEFDRQYLDSYFIEYRKKE